MRSGKIKSYKLATLRILFLSYESSHDKIFLNIIQELEKVSGLWFKILDSKTLFSRPLSIRFSYKKEIHHFKQIIDKAKPDVFVVGNDQGISSTFIRLCKLRGIPSLVIQDGILANETLKGFSRFLSLRRYLPWRIISKITNTSIISLLSILLGRQWCIAGWGTGNATVVAVTGKYYKQILVSRGVNPSKIVIAGYPLLDNLPNNHNLDVSANFFKEIGLDNKRPVILLITQPLVKDGFWKPEFSILHFDSVVNAVKHVNGQLVIKVHPRESVDTYKRLADKHDDVRIMVTKDLNLDKLILSSNVVLTVSSTVGLLAMAYRKPLLITNYFPLSMENILASLALNIDKIDKLPDILNQILTDEQQKATLIERQLLSLSDHLYDLDGLASIRIAKLIIAICNNNPSELDYPHFFKYQPEALSVDRQIIKHVLVPSR